MKKYFKKMRKNELIDVIVSSSTALIWVCIWKALSYLSQYVNADYKTKIALCIVGVIAGALAFISSTMLVPKMIYEMTD